MRGRSALVVLALALMTGAAHAQTQAPRAPPPPPGEFYAHLRPAFSLRVPPGFTINERHRYTRLGPGKAIEGVAFMIPRAMTEGTNLAADSYVSVEWRDGQRCTLADFLADATEEEQLNDNGVRWQVGTAGDAGAGNIYEETVHLRGCDAVRGFVHSTNIANYPPGTVRAYDRVALGNAVDAIRRSLKWGGR
ncbi:MAG: hypothetical protein NTV97_33555 [Alphaproteobacteria bacterium]|nr:hypothetical protein [Alphaproteobacteria bacterium]